MESVNDLEQLWTYCLNSHYHTCDHHPEHFTNPDQEMTLEARMELTCDLLGSVKGVFKKYNLNVSLPECRNIIEKQNWRHWKFALKEYLPEPSSTTPFYPLRWKAFPEREKLELKELFMKLKSKHLSTKEVRDLMMKLDSVKFYMADLWHHKSAVKEVYDEISAFHSDEMERRILNHDNDKYDTDMILGYTAQWCFKR
jgi:hypothetical protein